jgi:hypothetical protein
MTTTRATTSRRTRSTTSARRAESTKSRSSKKKKDDEFEVEGIVDMSTTSEDGVTIKMYKVACVGYDEQTWEPEDNLPKELIARYNDAKQSGGSTQDFVSTGAGGATANSPLVAALAPQDAADNVTARSIHHPTSSSLGRGRSQPSSPVENASSLTAPGRVPLPATSPWAETPRDSTTEPFEDGDDECADDGNEDEYEVEKILDMTIASENDVAVRKFKVAWVGYNEPTWEPESNLPKDMVASFCETVAQHVNCAGSGSLQAEQSPTKLVCATCGDGPGCPDRACARCKKPIHRLCATEVGRSLGLGNADGVFPNDVCYCSKACYNRRTSPARTSKQKRARPSQDSGDSDLFDEGSNQDQHTKKAKKVPTLAKQAHSNVDHEAIHAAVACPTCGDGPDGLGSECARCKKPMHHFCATDVCKSLGLKNADSSDIVEFPNDICYCSKDCYNRRPGAVRAAKQKRVRPPQDRGDSDYSVCDGEETDNVEDSECDEAKPVTAPSIKTKKKKKISMKKNVQVKATGPTERATPQKRRRKNIYHQP